MMTKRDRPAEIEVTPAMVEAGVEAFDRKRGRLGDLWDPSDDGLVDFLSEVFRAMNAARKIPSAEGACLGDAATRLRAQYSHGRVSPKRFRGAA